MRYSTEPRDQVYFKGYGKEKMGNGLSSKYGQNFLDSTEKSATNALKTVSKRVFKKTAEATGDLGGNEMTEKITKAASKSTHENPSKSTVATKLIESSKQQIGIPKEKYQRKVTTNYW